MSFLKEYQSHEVRIVRVFRDMELVEQLGSGIPRILQSYDRNCFYFSENYVRMSFPVEQGLVPYESVEPNVGADVGADVGANVGVDKLYLIILEKPGLNAKQLNEYFDVTSRTTERWIKQLKDESKIIFKGNPKTGGYWANPKHASNPK